MSVGSVGGEARKWKSICRRPPSGSGCMPEKETTLRRIVARVRCMLPKDWLGPAGKRFRQTTTAISDFSEQHIRLGEKVDAAPELAWRALQGAANGKYARALKDYAEVDKTKRGSE